MITDTQLIAYALRYLADDADDHRPRLAARMRALAAATEDDADERVASEERRALGAGGLGGLDRRADGPSAPSAEAVEELDFVHVGHTPKSIVQRHNLTRRSRLWQDVAATAERALDEGLDFDDLALELNDVLEWLADVKHVDGGTPS
jgi:hypothetical protein